MNQAFGIDLIQSVILKTLPGVVDVELTISLCSLTRGFQNQTKAVETTPF